MYVEHDGADGGQAALDEVMASAYRSCYRVALPAVVERVRAWERKLAAFHQARRALGQAFGGEASAMRWFQAHFVGGVRLSGGVELERHWRKPDVWGYRQLRSKPRVPKGMRVVTPAMIEAEHARLHALWADLCPPRIDAGEVWQALGVHLGSVALWGGLFFNRSDATYLALGFRHDRQGEAKVRERGEPGIDWLNAATPIDLDELKAAWAAMEPEHGVHHANSL